LCLRFLNLENQIQLNLKITDLVGQHQKEGYVEVVRYFCGSILIISLTYISKILILYGYSKSGILSILYCREHFLAISKKCLTQV